MALPSRRGACAPNPGDRGMARALFRQGHRIAPFRQQGTPPLNTAPPPDTTFAWDQYWRDGRLASCGGEGGQNYQPAIAEGWRRFFDRLENGARVLDICTGNGAVARLAAEAARARNVTVAIEAVDSAMLHPMGLESAPGAGMIHFRPRTPVESLPFPDASFDVIVGQYAVEYTDVERSLAELARVSRNAARVRFVTHAAGSVVVEGASRQLADAERLTSTGIFEAAHALAMAADRQPPAAAMQEAVTHFRRALQILQDAARGAVDPVMYRNVGDVLVHALQHQSRVGTQPVLDKIAETATAIRAHQARLSAMRNAALDEAAAQALAAAAQRHWGRAFESAPLVRDDGAVFGWVIVSA